MKPLREGLIEVIRQTVMKGDHVDCKTCTEGVADAIIERLELDKKKLADLIEFNVDLLLEKDNDPLFGGKITSINPKKLAYAVSAQAKDLVCLK